VFEGFSAASEEVRGVFLTGDGAYPQVLYFGLLAVDPDVTDKKGNWDIMFAIRDRAGKDFTPTRGLNTIDSPVDELHPWLTPGAKEIYFSRKTSKGWGVWVAKRTNNAPAVPSFGEPAQLEDLPPGFHHPTLTPDGQTMYLQGPLEKERWGLFVSTRTKTGWSKPEALDVLNDPAGKTGDRSPNLSRDGLYLYFASDRPGGQGGLDIWMVATKDLVKKKN
jgi:hypothetical protein